MKSVIWSLYVPFTLRAVYATMWSPCPHTLLLKGKQHINCLWRFSNASSILFMTSPSSSIPSSTDKQGSANENWIGDSVVLLVLEAGTTLRSYTPIPTLSVTFGKQSI